MRVALLNSRKPRQIDPDVFWLRETFALAGAMARAGDVLVTSIGNLPYEAVLYGAAKEGGQIEVVLPSGATEADARVLLPEGYPEDRLVVRAVSLASGPARDRAVIDAAELAVAVAVRTGGHMEALLRDRWLERRGVAALEAGPWAETAGNRRLAVEGVPGMSPEPGLPKRGGPVCGRADCGWSDGAGARELDARDGADAGDAQGLQRSGSGPEKAARLYPCESWRRAPLAGPTLAHFTRACQGPWPGQTRRDYLEDLWVGGQRARRDGAATLRRILATGRIQGSGRLIRGGFPVVSLTAVAPDGLLELHRYRQHLLRWDFEPLGLVFSREWLEAYGARPVAYLPPDAFAGLAAAERPWYQKHQPPTCDYSAEREWRVLGDIDLSVAPADAVRVFRD